MKILQRLKTSIFRKYYKYLSQTKHKIVNFMKCEFVVFPKNYIDRRIWIEGGYEKEQLLYLLSKSNNKQYDLFIDIGANFGLYSCIMGKSGNFKDIHSFECDPRNMYHFHGHIQMNDLHKKITPHQIAIGNENSEVTLNLAPDNNTGHSYVGKANKTHNSIKVEQKKLDDIINIKNKNIIIKIDVEGYEEFVLKGMLVILEKNNCIIQIEILDKKEEKVKDLLPNNYKNINIIGNDFYFSNNH